MRRLGTISAREKSSSGSLGTTGTPASSSTAALAGASASERLRSLRRDRPGGLGSGGSDPAPRRGDALGVDDDCAEYADRFLPGYDRLRLLGRGACAVVWLAAPTGSKQQPVAVKQAAKGTSVKKMTDAASARREIFFGSFFFHAGGEPKFPPTQHPGVLHLARLLEHAETKRDVWLVMEYGGTCLTKMVYEIKGEFIGTERVYRVHHLSLLQTMKQRPAVLKGLLRQLLSALALLADNSIVHSDIKPDNILIEDEHGRLRARFIDMGSAYAFGSGDSVQVATPEYMPPEALDACVARSAIYGGTSGRSSLHGSAASRRSPASAPAATAATASAADARPWSFDVWSLGAILLELSLGVPLWLAYKCRVADDQPSMGLFAVPGRDPEKILAKQSDAVRTRGLRTVLRNAHGVPLSDPDLLVSMLAWSPVDRPAPRACLNHPWLNDPA